MSAVARLDSYLVCAGGEVIAAAVAAAETQSLAVRKLHLKNLRHRLEETMRRLEQAEAECAAAITANPPSIALAAVGAA